MTSFIAFLIAFGIYVTGDVSEAADSSNQDQDKVENSTKPFPQSGHTGVVITDIGGA